MSFELHHVARLQLSAPANLDFAVDLYQTVADDGLGVGAIFDQ